MLGEKNTLHSSLRIVTRLWNMVVVVSWLGPVLLHLGQDSLPSLMEQWILNYTSKFWRKTSGYLFKNRVSRERGSCSKTTTPSTQVILPKNSLRTTFLSPELNPIKMLWKDLSKQFIEGNPPTSQSLIGSALRNGLKLLHVIVQDWSAFTRNFTFSYCSKRGSHQKLKAKIHILSMHRYVTLDNVSQINEKIFFLSLVWFGSFCLLSGLIWRSDDILCHIYAEI